MKIKIFRLISVFALALLLGGCAKSFFMTMNKTESDAERKERVAALHAEFKKLEANQEIIIRTKDGTDVAGRFLYYREGFVTLQTGILLRDYELSEIQGFAYASKSNTKRWMVALMLLIAAYIIFEFTRSTS